LPPSCALPDSSAPFVRTPVDHQDDPMKDHQDESSTAASSSEQRAFPYKGRRAVGQGAAGRQDPGDLKIRLSNDLMI